jgi:hypothetical protein
MYRTVFIATEFHIRTPREKSVLTSLVARLGISLENFSIDEQAKWLLDGESEPKI